MENILFFSLGFCACASMFLFAALMGLLLWVNRSRALVPLEVITITDLDANVDARLREALRTGWRMISVQPNPTIKGMMDIRMVNR